MQDTGIILRVNNYQDRDLICSVLSKENGRITFNAKNAKGSKKRFSGGIDIFDCAKFDLSKKNYLQSYNKLEQWSNLSTSPKLFSLSSFCLEVILALTQEGQEEAKDFFVPLFLSLRALNSTKDLDKQKSISIFFAVKVLNLSGFGIPFSKNKNLNDFMSATGNSQMPIMPKNNEVIKSSLNLVKASISELTGKEIRSLTIIE